MPDSITRDSMNEFITTLAVTISQENAKAIAALREDKDNRHATANVAQDALDLATVNRTRIESLENKVTAVLGDGTGETGAFAKMSDRQRQAQLDITEVKLDVRIIKDSIAKLEAIGEQSKSAMSGGKALVKTLGILATFCTVVGAIVAGIIWVYRH